MADNRDDPRCGFIAVVGAPNVGKSTLVNRLVGAKVSIVSPKVQTTRARVMGICIHGQTQLVFIDTPGIFRPRRRLGWAMVAAAWGGAGGADRILLLVDSAKKGIDSDTRNIVRRLKEQGKDMPGAGTRRQVSKLPAMLGPFSSKYNIW